MSCAVRELGEDEATLGLVGSAALDKVSLLFSIF